MARWPTTAARIGAQMIRRYRLSSATILLLALLPLLAGVYIMTATASLVATGPKLAVWRMGAADAIAYPLPADSVQVVQLRLDDALFLAQGAAKPHSPNGLFGDSIAATAPGKASYPPQTVTVSGRSAVGALTTAGYNAQLTDGMLETVAGRLPKAGSEVALSTTMASALSPDRPLELIGKVFRSGTVQGTVVGVVRDPECLTCSQFFGLPDASLATGSPSYPYIPVRGVLIQWRKGTPIDAAVLKASRAGILLVPRQAFLGEGQSHVRQSLALELGLSRRALVSLSLLAISGVGVLTSIGFSVVSRRSLRSAGTLAANGASRGQILLVYVSYAGILFVCAAAGSLAVDWLAQFGSHGFLEHLENRRLVRWAIPLRPVALILLVTMAAMVVSAVLPARKSATVGLIYAIEGGDATPSGRKHLGRRRRGTVFLVICCPFILFALLRLSQYETVNATYNDLIRRGFSFSQPNKDILIVGAGAWLVLCIGAVTYTPTLPGWILRIASSRNSLPVRLSAQALREASSAYRGLTRLVAISTVVVFTVVGASIGLTGRWQSQTIPVLPANSLQVAIPAGMSPSDVSQLRETLAARVSPLANFEMDVAVSSKSGRVAHFAINHAALVGLCPRNCSADTQTSIAVADPDFLRFVLPVRDVSRGVRALMTGQVVTGSPLAVAAKRIIVGTNDADSGLPTQHIAVGIDFPNMELFGDLPQTFVTKPAARALGLSFRPFSLFFDLRRPLSSLALASLDTDMRARNLSYNYSGALAPAASPTHSLLWGGMAATALVLACAIALITMGLGANFRMLILLGARPQAVVCGASLASAAGAGAGIVTGFGLVCIGMPLVQLAVGSPQVKMEVGALLAYLGGGLLVALVAACAACLTVQRASGQSQFLNPDAAP